MSTPASNHPSQLDDSLLYSEPVAPTSTCRVTDDMLLAGREFAMRQARLSTRALFPQVLTSNRQSMGGRVSTSPNYAKAEEWLHRSLQESGQLRDVTSSDNKVYLLASWETLSGRSHSVDDAAEQPHREDDE